MKVKNGVLSTIKKRWAATWTRSWSIEQGVVTALHSTMAPGTVSFLVVVVCLVDACVTLAVGPLSLTLPPLFPSSLSLYKSHCVLSLACMWLIVQQDF